jgi:hypothetical protein
VRRCTSPLLPREGGDDDQRDQRKASGDQEGADQIASLGHPPADEAHQDGRGVDGRPLHRLEGPGQPVLAALLHHERVGQHVGEGESEAHGREQHEQRPVLRGAQGRGQETGRGGQRGRQDQIADPSPPEQREEIREQSVKRLDQPRRRADHEEVGDASGAVPRVLEDDRDRLVREVPHALREVDDREQQRQTTALGRLERIQPPQAAEHRAIIV